MGTNSTQNKANWKQDRTTDLCHIIFTITIILQCYFAANLMCALVITFLSLRICYCRFRLLNEFYRYFKNKGRTRQAYAKIQKTIMVGMLILKGYDGDYSKYFFK